MTTRQDPYHARMKRVLSYIDRHLEDDLGLDTLGAVAALSKYHFHRQFRGYSAYQCIATSNSFA